VLNVTTEPAKILDNLTKEFKKLQKEAQPIEKSFNAAFDARKAIWLRMKEVLDKVRKGKYYKAKYKTFTQYCQNDLGYSRSYVHRLGKAVKVNQQLALENVAHFENGQQISERQARELAVVPEEERAEVLEDVKKKGKPTAKKIRDAVKKHTAKPEVPKDKEGYPIPDMALPIWARRDEVKDKLAMLYELRQWSDDMQGTRDLLYGAEISFSTLSLQIEAVIQTIKGAVPHAVCTKCHGEDPGCDFCKGRGMISKYRYHAMPATPVEIKKMRETRIAQSA
jgi:hypothetical protein